MAHQLLRSETDEIEGVQAANELYQMLISQQTRIANLEQSQKRSNVIFIVVILFAIIVVTYSNQYQMQHKMNNKELIAGPRGPQGLQGEEGESGINGKDGIDGKDGLDGKNGKDGNDGNQLSETYITEIENQKAISSLLQTNVDKLMPFITRDATFSVKGSWSINGGQQPFVTFTFDDGSMIDGLYDTGIKHYFNGLYVTTNRIDGIGVRVDATGRTMTVRFTLIIKDQNTMHYSQMGWKGWGLDTPHGTQVWSRR